MDKNAVIVAIALVLGFTILGGFYFAVQVNKQTSIEKQQILELETEKSEKTEAERKAANNKMLLNLCLSQADTARWEYLKLNGTVTTDANGEERVDAQQRFFDYADKAMKDSKDTCFKKYSQ